MQKCVKKEKFDCIQFTKENRDEFLKIMEPRLDGKRVFITEDNDRYCSVKHWRSYSVCYFYHHWYVLGEDGDYLWNRYSPEDFQEMFKLVE